MKRTLLFLLAILPTMLLAQHTIKGTFTPPEAFKFAFLYRVTEKTAVFVANADVDENGKFEIKLGSEAIPGTYRLVYAQPQEKNNFDLFYSGKEDVELNFDAEKGLSFVSSLDNKLYASYNKSIALVNQSIRNYYSKQTDDKEGYARIFEILTRTQNEFEAAAKGTLALDFIKACKPYIPSDYEDVTTFSKNVKANYFKNIDFSNKALQKSNFLIKNTVSYVFNFIDRNNKNNSYIANVDTAVKAIGDNPEIKKVLLEILWNQFAEEENEVAANYITTTYLSDLAKAEKDDELLATISAFKNASIGNVAPNFSFETTDKKGKSVSKKLSELDASENYLIFFWSTVCSHCLDEIPQLKEYIASKNKEQIQVIAIALDNDQYRWKNMTYDFPDFIHVYGEGKWENAIGNAYNVSATPSYFVLDKDKKITAKPYDIDAFKSYFSKISSENKE